MAYPDLYSDETIVFNAQNIKVKSVSFEAVLTTRRLILIDSKKHLIAPQEILLATLRDIEIGENAIRDPTLTLSIITNTGATRQMILTFSKTSGGGERKRECDEWAKILRQHISSAVQHPIMPDVPTHSEQPAITTNAGPAPVRMDVSNIPVVPSPKKKIEIARPGPMKKIVETAPSMPKPVETTTLPTGSFCNRCGSRVPPESAFCNKCGTPVIKESDINAQLALPAETPASSVPQVHMPMSPVFGAGADKKERPIEDVIHSIEPLIEDSVPRTVPAPIIPKQHAQPAAGMDTIPAPQASESGAIPAVKWPVITPSASPATGETAPAEPPSPPPHYPVPPAVSRAPKLLIIGVLAIVILAIIAAVFIFANPLGGAAVTPTPTPTPEVTAAATIAPTTVQTEAPVTTAIPETTPAPVTPPQLIVPPQGVWVHVLYDNQFTGSVGTPGAESDVSGSGEKYIPVATSEGIVVATIQKVDGSSDKLTVEVYKNGEKVTEKSTGTPKGIVEIQADLKPAPTPTPTPTPTKVPIPVENATVSSNTTVNATVTTPS
ncbi:MAG: zinc-ribbon domain-containing protein [Methanoregula sp.]|jgi:hypothetical protein|uniref:zinc ribbon domain-containing protein n=1 Tax=Methanoregula sp. TaxID=2052170 RepID=UPI003C1F1A43